MSYKIAIASGKGGTGKTTVSINLFRQLYDKMDGSVQLVDCDVEEPNDLIFFSEAEKTKGEEIFQQIPVIDKEKCTFCRRCAEYCEFNAIVVVPTVEFAEVNTSLCHSCGACLVACQNDAITERPESIGHVNFYKTSTIDKLAEGKLKIGSSMQTMLIGELKKRVLDDVQLTLFDSPPGTSCPVVETVTETDFVVLVTEPTPFGLHDMKLMVELLRELSLPFGVVINKAGLGDTAVYDYLKQENIELLGEIPFSKKYASLYASGNIAENIPPEIADSYLPILEKLTEKMAQA